MGDFANVLKQLRLASHMTQNDLAQRLGLSRSRVSMYESGSREPDFETLEMIADYFNVDVDYLLGRTSKTTMIPEAGYYLNPETAKAAQEMLDNKELRVLFDAARDAKPEDLKTVYDMLMALKRKEQGDPDGWA